MTVEARVRKRIAELVDMGQLLQVGSHGQVRDDAHAAECRGWITAAENAVSLACPLSSNRYRVGVERLAASETAQGYAVNAAVGEIAAVLRHLVADIDGGLITNVVDQARSETLDDLLDAATEYHSVERKDGSGILATAVFEDTLRRIARKNEIADKGVKTDTLITQLAHSEAITAIIAKRCRAAAGVRNSALHGQWDEFSLDDVNSVIVLTRELLTAHLS